MRLIDADECLEHLHMINFCDLRDLNEVWRLISDTPTVNPHDLCKTDMNNRPVESASIIFRPVCSRCGGRLFGETIDYVPNTQMSDLCTRPHVFADYMIQPDECPHCHALFDRIEIPSILPYTDKG